MEKKKTNKPRSISYAEILQLMQQRKTSVKNALLNAYGDKKLSLDKISLLAIMEVYNQAFINDIASNDLVQLLADGKKLPFYNKELARLFNRIEKKRAEYAKYVKEVLTTDDGLFCDAADIYEEEVRNMLTLLYVNIKQALDNLGIDYSAFRAKLEVMKTLIYTSLDIYVEVSSASEISVYGCGDRTGTQKVIVNEHSNLASLLWLVCCIEQYIGFTPEVDNEELRTISEQMVQKVALGGLAMDCLNKVAEGRDRDTLPEWFPKEIKVIKKD